MSYKTALNRKARHIALMFLILVVGCAAEPTIDTDTDTINELDPELLNYNFDLFAGARASSYGAPNPFPNPAYWEEVGYDMTGEMGVQSAAPAMVWLVGTIDERICNLNFPANASDPYIVGSGNDFNKEFFKAFDRAGVKVFLQAESGDADMEELITVVLDRYHYHPSVIGFGVDVEWYHEADNPGDGKQISDAEAETWYNLVKSYNPEYRIFFKHWDPEWMPPTFRGNGEDVLFLNDAQSTGGWNPSFDEWVYDTLRGWAEYFYPYPVGFQYGYESDREWWEPLGSDAPFITGRALLDMQMSNDDPDGGTEADGGTDGVALDNVKDLYWVDFTVDEIWPVSETGGDGTGGSGSDCSFGHCKRSDRSYFEMMFSLFGN